MEESTPRRKPGASPVAAVRGVLAGLSVASFAAISQLSTLALPIDALQWVAVLCFSVGILSGVAGFFSSYVANEFGTWLVDPPNYDRALSATGAALAVAAIATLGGLACIAVRLLGSLWWFVLFAPVPIGISLACDYLVRRVEPRVIVLHRNAEAAEARRGGEESIDK